MFISSSRPLKETTVRLDGDRQFELDSSGQLEAELDEGTYRVDVRVDDDWVSTTIDVREDDDTLVVDIHSEDRIVQKPGLVGRTLGDRYHIKAVLGQGGMGTVYRAEDARLERPVAIKTLNEQFRQNEEAGRLFLQEARQMAPLSHPHLVSVYDVTTIDDYDMMVTELVEGSNLEDWVQEHGPMGVDDALIIAYQMTVAVAFLHDRQMIHRDLKPANAVLENEGGLKLIDFGLARSLEQLMAKGTAVRGTPAYMAPEQATGPGPSSATDIYQLGVTFYELLTGELPANPDGQGILAYATAQLEPIAAHRSDLPTPLVELIEHCLKKDPDQRPTADDIADRLADLYYERNDRRPPSSISPGNWSPPNDKETAIYEGDAQASKTDDSDEDIDGEDIDDGNEDDKPQSPHGDGSRDRPPHGDGPPLPPHGEPPESHMPGRDPDYTGASSSGDVDWDRPSGRIVLIITVLALLFGVGVLLHSLFIAPGDDDSLAPTPQQELLDDDQPEQLPDADPESTDDQRGGAIDDGRRFGNFVGETGQQLTGESGVDATVQTQPESTEAAEPVAEPEPTPPSPISPPPEADDDALSVEDVSGPGEEADDETEPAAEPSQYIEDEDRSEDRDSEDQQVASEADEDPEDRQLAEVQPQPDDDPPVTEEEGEEHDDDDQSSDPPRGF